MLQNWLVIFFFIVLITGCNSNPDQKGDKEANDSAESAAAESDSDRLAFTTCYENFFEGLPRFKDSGSAYLILKDKREVSITRFFQEEFMSPVSEYGKKDLDGDGVPELVIYNNTGGAHCCDEFYLFHQKSEKEFEYTGHLMSGSVCVNASTNIFTFSFSETFGYFFGCYACGFHDSTGTFKTMREVQVRYKRPNLVIVPYDPDAEKQNLLNLLTLQKHGYEKMDGMMDNGWRKEFAMNFAIWHYNHGKNWQKTKQLFEKYYRFIDSAKVWKEFYRTMMDTAKENTF